MAKADGIMGSMSLFSPFLTHGLSPCLWNSLGSSLLWALSSGPLATLALSTDALPKLIPCSLNDSHIPSMHRQQAIYVLDWLLCPSSGRRSLVRHISCTEVWH